MEFISYNSPSQFKSSKQASHTIRSHVTKRQHRLKHEAREKALEDKQPWVDDAAQQAPSSSSSSKSATPTHGEESETKQRAKPLSKRKSAYKKSLVLMRSSPPTLPPQVPDDLMFPCDSAFNTLESYLHLTMIPSHVVALGMNQSESQVSSHWFSSASVIEPALYTSALLTAAPNLKRHSPELLHHLRSATITHLVQALSNEQRRQDHALVLAVECLTFFECLHGDRATAQNVHRPAMRKLIRLHGGRDALAIPVSWKKVSIMADIIMEMQMGSESESSFLEDERHENASILDSEWTEALRIYLPDLEGGISNKAPEPGATTAAA